MSHTTASPNLPKGLAFDISDHVRAGQWASANGFRLAVDLSYGVGDEEYEEVLMFYSEKLSRRLSWVMWRQADGIVVQPVVGRPTRFRSVREALRRLTPARD